MDIYLEGGPKLPTRHWELNRQLEVVQVHSCEHHPCNYIFTEGKYRGAQVYEFDKEYSDFYYEPLYLEGGPNDFYWGRDGTVLLVPNDTVTVNNRIYKRTNRIRPSGFYFCTVFEFVP
jgi:hypothetical protein